MLIGSAAAGRGNEASAAVRFMPTSRVGSEAGLQIPERGLLPASAAYRFLSLQPHLMKAVASGQLDQELPPLGDGVC